jgi:hypothetical protein
MAYGVGRATDREVRIRQGRRWQIQRSRIESIRICRRSTVACLGFVTEGEAIHSDPATAVSSGRSTDASGEDPNCKREQWNVGLTSGMAPANQLRLSFIGSEDGEAETATCRAAKPCGERRIEPPARQDSTLRNRPVRTRMPGGVAGRVGDHSRYADFWLNIGDTTSDGDKTAAKSRSSAPHNDNCRMRSYFRPPIRVFSRRRRRAWLGKRPK